MALRLLSVATSTRILFSKRIIPSVSSREFFRYNHMLQNNNDNIHRSNAEFLISKVPVVEVDKDWAMCDGGGGQLGHPMEWIQLNDIDPGTPKPCKYCGVRFQKKAHDDHH